MVPSESEKPRNDAGFSVAARRASAGEKPASTRRANSSWRQRTVPVAVNVHIPQAGNQELAPPIDYSNLLRSPDLAARTYGINPAIRDQNCHVGFGGTVTNVDYRDVNESNPRRSGWPDWG